jgi:hypothetical protein
MAVRQRAKSTTPAPTELPSRAQAEQAILAELAAMADELADIEARRTELYDRRRELYVRGRGMTPPVSGARMAEAARVSDAALVLSARRGTTARAAS